MKDINISIKEMLLANAEDSYREFSSKLIPSCNNILGVRIPCLRKMAKQLAKEDYKIYLDGALDESFEEIMLQGLVIGYIKADIDEVLYYAEKFIGKIDNWSVNDTFCSNLKIAKREQKKVFEFLKKYIQSNSEFELRVVAIMLMDYFLDDGYIEEVIEILKNMNHDGYYLKMAVAWALATAYVTYPERVRSVITKGELDIFTNNKTIQKITESYRVSNEDKIYLKTFKRKKN